MSDAPVTVFARYQVRAERKAEFESWLEGIAAACATYAGYLGTEVIRPSRDEPDDYVVIFRFDTVEHLEAWMESDQRQTWIDRVSELSAAPPQLQYHSLEFWFSPDRLGGSPQRYKMALVTLAVIWPMVHFIPPAVNRFLEPPLVAEVSGVAIIVLLMTYVVMPSVTRLLEPWLKAGRSRR